MEQFFLRAVEAQLLVKANTGLFHRPALEAESLSLSSGTMAFLHSAPDMSLCKPRNGERAGVKRGHRRLRGRRTRGFLERSFIYFFLNYQIHLEILCPHSNATSRNTRRVFRFRQSLHNFLRNHKTSPGCKHTRGRGGLTCWSFPGYICTAGPAARSVHSSTLVEERKRKRENSSR